MTLVGAIVTIPASPMLIFGLGPFPRLGISGAGLAFGLYYSAAMLVLLRYMATGRSGLTLRIVRLRWRLFADILKVGVPTAVNAMLTNLTVILVTAAVGLFGTKALAGYGISSRLDYIMIPLLFGISTATLTMVGVNMGAGQIARARKIGWTSGLVGLTITGTIGLLVAMFPMVWLHLFSKTQMSCRKARPICGSSHPPIARWVSALPSPLQPKAPAARCGRSPPRSRAS